MGSYDHMKRRGYKYVRMSCVRTIEKAVWDIVCAVAAEKNLPAFQIMSPAVKKKSSSWAFAEVSKRASESILTSDMGDKLEVLVLQDPVEQKRAIMGGYSSISDGLLGYLTGHNPATYWNARDRLRKKRRQEVLSHVGPNEWADRK